MIVALNNKSNKTQEEFKEYITEISNIQTNETLIVCPTFLNIPFVPENILLGSQNVSKFVEGAYTGEISARQLKSYNVKYAIVGHSERREYQKETNKDIQEKITRLKEENMIPILCIGETLEERQNQEFKRILQEELEIATEGLTEEEKQELIIAYEPIWSIGTGIIPSKEQIEEVFEFIKKDFPKTPVLYGGSANEENIEMLREISLIDGYLLGGLSLKPEKLKIFLEKLK